MPDARRLSSQDTYRAPDRHALKRPVRIWPTQCPGLNRQQCAHPVLPACQRASDLPCIRPRGIGRSGRTNIVRLSRRSHGALAPDSAKDHESPHRYSLPGIVMYARNALLSARPSSSNPPIIQVGARRRSGATFRSASRAGRYRTSLLCRPSPCVSLIAITRSP